MTDMSVLFVGEMRVLFVGEKGDSASSFYRCYQPAKALGADFVHVLLQREDGRLTGAIWDDNRLYQTTVPDIIVCRRTTDINGVPVSAAPLFQEAQSHGQRIFLDIDDNIWHIPSDNPAYNNPLGIKQLEDEIQVVDGILTTTQTLADEIRLHTDRPIYVCPNGIDPERYPQKSRNERTPLRVGWMGLTSFRGRDLAAISDPLREALLKYGCEFWHLGRRVGEPLLSNFIDLDGIPTYSRHWVPIQRIAESLAYVDVLVIPQVVDRFSNCRSATTGLAAMAAGVPYFATASPEYERLWVEGGGYCIPARGTYSLFSDMQSAFDVMCAPEYSVYRDDMARSGKVLALSRYNISETSKAWRSVFLGDA